MIHRSLEHKTMFGLLKKMLTKIIFSYILDTIEKDKNQNVNEKMVNDIKRFSSFFS